MKTEQKINRCPMWGCWNRVHIIQCPDDDEYYYVECHVCDYRTRSFEGKEKTIENHNSIVTFKNRDRALQTLIHVYSQMSNYGVMKDELLAVIRVFDPEFRGRRGGRRGE